MTASLNRWMADADALLHVEHFQVRQSTLELAHIRSRASDYYIALVGKLFQIMRDGAPGDPAWSRLGNAFAQLAASTDDQHLRLAGISKVEATLYAAAAFYCGGFPASAHLTIRSAPAPMAESEEFRACVDLLARPNQMTSQVGQTVLQALAAGNMELLVAMGQAVHLEQAAALRAGPDAWIPAKLLDRLLGRLLTTNVRAVLPDGGSGFWTPLVHSFLNRRPAAWEFFPSQIDAIQRGLLTRSETFSLQMPTGAGKTALCETLLYWHAKTSTSGVAVLVVPYRSLASELRNTVVKRLNRMGISARCAYGGTVPSGEEVSALDDTRVLVATPEALSGLFSADAEFFKRVSLVICDEGHLLDGGGRGVGLELLLARLRSREGGPPRFVFVSAIVPNIEEINLWLGGSDETVVKSDYRPALAEYAVLRSHGSGAARLIALDMHAHESSPTRYQIEGFLTRSDFRFVNPMTGRQNTYGFDSIKTHAVASARKALAMGAAAVFAANKRGDQGAVGLAEELVKQLDSGLPLPKPIDFASVESLSPAARYLQLEFGQDWLGSRLVAAGAVLHHGDIPQETREVLEALLRTGGVRFVICTTTLAEGVNLPIRTLVLYSVQRRMKGGRAENLLARDIKNLVGRAGRAGATTKGLVICANEQQWGLVEAVARQSPGEPVYGALRGLVIQLRQELIATGLALTNGLLETSPRLHALVDGVDTTLVDLAAEELGQSALVERAMRLANGTFASQRTDPESAKVLQDVFQLRARRVFAARAAGHLDWVRETGARLRIVDAVETGLLPLRQTWDDVLDPLDPEFTRVLLEWAWIQPDIQEALRDAFRFDDASDTSSLKSSFFAVIRAWLGGMRFHEMAVAAGLEIDQLLTVHARVVSFALQTQIEQGFALLAKLLSARESELSTAAQQFPEHLRFGVPTGPARVLAASGVRHRSAAVQLGNALVGSVPDMRFATRVAARALLKGDPAGWRARLGDLVYNNTIDDLTTPKNVDGEPGSQ